MPSLSPCTGAALGHRVVITTTTSIHWPPRGDQPTPPAHPSTKLGTKPISEGSTALPQQQQLPAWLSTTPIIKMVVKYFIICSNYPQIIEHWHLLLSQGRRGGILGRALRCPHGLLKAVGCGWGGRLAPVPTTQIPSEGATQEGSNPLAPQAGATGETPISLGKSLSSHFAEILTHVFWDPSLPHWCSLCHRGAVDRAFQLVGPFCQQDQSFQKCSDLPYLHPHSPSSLSSPSSVSILYNRPSLFSNVLLIPILHLHP